MIAHSISIPGTTCSPRQSRNDTNNCNCAWMPSPSYFPHWVTIALALFRDTWGNCARKTRKAWGRYHTDTSLTFFAMFLVIWQCLLLTTVSYATSTELEAQVGTNNLIVAYQLSCSYTRQLCVSAYVGESLVNPRFKSYEFDAITDWTVLIMRIVSHGAHGWKSL